MQSILGRERIIRPSPFDLLRGPNRNIDLVLRGEPVESRIIHCRDLIVEKSTTIRCNDIYIERDLVIRGTTLTLAKYDDIRETQYGQYGSSANYYPLCGGRFRLIYGDDIIDCPDGSQRGDAILVSPVCTNPDPTYGVECPPVYTLGGRGGYCVEYEYEPHFGGVGGAVTGDGGVAISFEWQYLYIGGSGWVHDFEQVKYVRGGKGGAIVNIIVAGNIINDGTIDNNGGHGETSEELDIEPHPIQDYSWGAGSGSGGGGGGIITLIVLGDGDYNRIGNINCNGGTGAPRVIHYPERINPWYETPGGAGGGGYIEIYADYIDRSANLNVTSGIDSITTTHMAVNGRVETMSFREYPYMKGVMNGLHIPGIPYTGLPFKDRIGFV